MNRNINRLHKPMKYRPTLIIGLGGVGTSIARRCVKWIYELCEEEQLPPFVKILCFDTDTQASDEKKTPYLIDNVQFFNLGGFSAGRLLNAAKNRPADPNMRWLQPFIDADLKPGQIHRGAHGIPLIGRLCYAYSRGKKVIPALTSRCMDILDLTLPYLCKRRGYPLNPGNMTPTIHLLSSVCGGTGAGILIDVAFDIRQIILQYTNNDPDMVAHLVLPPIFQSKSNPLGNMHKRNAFYILRQIDYLMGGKREGRVSMESSNGQRSDLDEFETIFDTVYLINDRLKNKPGTENHIGRMIASFVMEPIGQKIDSMWDNIRVAKLGMEPVQVYCGYGLKSYLSPEKGLKILLFDGFMKFMKSLTESKSKESKPSFREAGSFLDEFIVKHTDKVDIQQIKRNIRKLNNLIKRDQTPDEIEDEFWDETLKIARISNVDFLPALFDYAYQIKKEYKEQSDKLEKDFLALESKILEPSQTGADLKEMAVNVNLRKRVLQGLDMVQVIEKKKNIFAGHLLLNAFEEYREELQDTVVSSEGLLNNDFSVLISKEILGNLSLSTTVWKAEYLALLGYLRERSDDDPENTVKSWLRDSIKGFMSTSGKWKEVVTFTKSISQQISRHEREVKKNMEEPSIQPFLRYEVTGGGDVDTVEYLQASMENNLDDEDKGYECCFVSKNCDWILCKTHLGFQLDHLKDFVEGTTSYKQIFLDELKIKDQVKLWQKPLFNIEFKQEMKEQEKQEHIYKEIFKVDLKEN